MNGRGTLGRAVRVGLLVAGVPALPWAALCLVVAAVEFLRGGDTALAAADLRAAGLLVGGTLLVGALTGLVLAGVLTLVARLLRGTAGLVLAGALLVGLLFPAVLLLLGAASDGGYAEIAVAFLLWPVMAGVAAVHSPDIVGRTRDRAWLWRPGPAARLRRG
ncbi:hypothetical protein ACWCV9_05905 [Streptomyces sp. NPDC001606]